MMTSIINRRKAVRIQSGEISWLALQYVAASDTDYGTEQAIIYIIRNPKDAEEAMILWIAQKNNTINTHSTE